GTPRPRSFRTRPPRSRPLRVTVSVIADFNSQIVARAGLGAILLYVATNVVGGLRQLRALRRGQGASTFDHRRIPQLCRRLRRSDSEWPAWSDGRPSRA